jgi:hypothetical protein
MSVGWAAGRPVISSEKKTASASESLAHNLAANRTNGEETVHAGTMRQHDFTVKRRKPPLGERNHGTFRP